MEVMHIPSPPKIMKSNATLQASLNFLNNAQVAFYAATVLKSALLSSPPLTAQKARKASPEVLAQTAKSARAASAAVLGVDNTTGYAFGELYLNSPAYPIGTPIPAIPAKPASAAVAYAAAVTALPEIKVPAVVALKGWEDAISINSVSNTFVITAQLPVTTSVGIVGSTSTVIGEITPPGLQATAWMAGKASNLTPGLNDPTILTLESLLFTYGKLCEHTISDSVRVVNGVTIACKTLVVTVYKSIAYDDQNPAPQLASIVETANAGS